MADIVQIIQIIASGIVFGFGWGLGQAVAQAFIADIQRRRQAA